MEPLTIELERLAKVGYESILKLAMPLPPEMEALVLPWEQEPEILHEHWRECIRAILTELREPSDVSATEGAIALESAQRAHCSSLQQAKGVFRTMIDHILEGK